MLSTVYVVSMSISPIMLDAPSITHAQRVVSGEVGALSHQKHSVRGAREERLGALAGYCAVVPSAREANVEQVLKRYSKVK